MFGPDGTAGSAGAGPRPAGTSWHSSVVPSLSQSQGSPAAAFRRSVALTSFDWPVAVSATHSSIPFGLMFVKDNRFASGEKLTLAMLGLAGTVIFLSVPSAIDFRVMAMTLPPRCWRPFVLGLIRAPAIRWIGSASSAIVGMLRRASNAIV